MYVQLQAFRLNNFGEEVPCGKLTIRKDSIAAVANVMAHNFDVNTGNRIKNRIYRGNTAVYLTSGQILHVEDNLSDVESILLNTGE